MEIKLTDDNGSAADFSSLLFQPVLGKTAEAKVSKRQSKLVSCVLIVIHRNFYTLPLPPPPYFKLLLVLFYDGAGEVQEDSS